MWQGWKSRLQKCNQNLIWIWVRFPLISINILFRSMRLSIDLQFAILISRTMFRTNFLCGNTMPFFDWATSIARKCFKLPRLFVWNWLNKCFLNRNFNIIIPCNDYIINIYNELNTSTRKCDNKRPNDLLHYHTAQNFEQN